MPNTRSPGAAKLIVDDAGPVAWVMLDRPEKLNALDIGMLEQITETFTAFARRDDLRVVIIAANGRAFCAGADIGDYERHSEASFLAYQTRFQAMCRSIEDLPFPVIAAVHGYALGGGLILANSCDLVVAADDARVGLPEVKIGLFGGGPRITRLLTRHQAAELMMVGDPISAERAAELGLVNRVVPGDRLLDAAEELAGVLAGRAPLAMAAIKRLIVQADGATQEVKLNLERATLGSLFATEDAREGVTAFVEKRTPTFSGR